MIDIEMINAIEEWGFKIEKEYHRTKAHGGIIGIKDQLINVFDVFDIWKEYQEYLDITFKELIEKLENEPAYIGDYKIYITYKLYHEYAEELTTFSLYLGDEFEKYLIDNEIELGNWQPSDVEEFFEQYGIEVY
jgi:hypothetical protein